jgi:hypothetical protein
LVLLHTVNRRTLVLHILPLDPAGLERNSMDSRSLIVLARELGAGICWLLAGLLVVLHARSLHHFAVNFPHADDFTQILCVPYYVALQESLAEKIAYVFSLSVDQPIATLRVAALAQSVLGSGLDFRALIFFGNALILAVGIMVLVRADRSYRPWLAPIGAALLLSPLNFEAQYWATGALQHFGVLAYAFGALACLKRRGPAWIAAGVLLALAAAFTSANGLMVFPAAVLLLWLTRRHREALAWAGLAALLFAWYFVGYDSKGLPMAQMLAHPWQPARFFLMALGSLARKPGAALVLGLVVALTWAWLAVRHRIKALPAELWTWFFFLSLSFAAITIGRFAFGEQGALLSRYRIYSELAALVTLVAVLHGATRTSVKITLVVIGALLLPWFVRSSQIGLPLAAHFSVTQQNKLNHYVIEGRGFYDAFPEQTFGDFMLGHSAVYGSFRPRLRADAAHDFVEDSRRLNAGDGTALRAEPPVFGTRAITVRGYIRATERAAALWLASPDRQYRSALKTLSMPTPIGKNWGFFWGTGILRGVAPGRYRIGYGVGDESSAVVWADKTVVVR